MLPKAISLHLVTNNDSCGHWFCLGRNCKQVVCVCRQG